MNAKKRGARRALSLGAASAPLRSPRPRSPTRSSIRPRSSTASTRSPAASSRSKWRSTRPCNSARCRSRRASAITRPPTDAPRTDAFVEVDEIDEKQQIKRIFSGWMFADSPGLHGVEHPIYDIWLTDCKGGTQVIHTPPKRPTPARRRPRRTPTSRRRPPPTPPSPRRRRRNASRRRPSPPRRATRSTRLRLPGRLRPRPANAAASSGASIPTTRADSARQCWSVALRLCRDRRAGAECPHAPRAAPPTSARANRGNRDRRPRSAPRPRKRANRAGSTAMSIGRPTPRFDFSVESIEIKPIFSAS